MGWGRFLLLGNLGQQLDIQEQQAELRRMRRSMRTHHRSGGEDVTALKSELNALEDEVDELRLYVAGVLRAVVSKGLCTAEEFRALVEVIDAEDGTLDERFKGPFA